MSLKEEALARYRETKAEADARELDGKRVDLAAILKRTLGLEVHTQALDLTMPGNPTQPVYETEGMRFSWKPYGTLGLLLPCPCHRGAWVEMGHVSDLYTLGERLERAEEDPPACILCSGGTSLPPEATGFSQQEVDLIRSLRGMIADELEASK